MNKERIREALEDVRKAYRLLYLYQARILTAVREFADLAGYEFFRFLPAGMDKGIQPGSDPLEADDWLFLPLLDASILYLPAGIDPQAQDPAHWMLEVRLHSDSLRPHRPKRLTRIPWAANPAGESLLVTYAHRPGESRQAWWTDLWYRSKWPESDDTPWMDADGRKVVRMTHRVEDLLDETGVSAAMTTFLEHLARHGYPPPPARRTPLA